MGFSIKPKIMCDDEGLIEINRLNPKQVFFVTDAFLVNNGVLNIIIEKINKNLKYFVYSDVKPDPSQELVDKAFESFKTSQSDFIIALGGGSSIDLAKAVIDKILSENYCKKPTFVAIPTTAGTGSEVTNFSVITRGEAKIVLLDDTLYPDYALLISQLTKTVPPAITADTGMDVLTHAVEAYLSTMANMFSDMFAIQSIKYVFENLHIVCEDGLRMKSREYMLKASCMAGVAFTNAGLGINHSLAHTVGAKFHKAHGRLNAILLPEVCKFNKRKSEYAASKLDKLAKELGLNKGDDFIEEIIKLRRKLNIPARLSELGIDYSEYSAQISEMAETAMQDRCTPTNPAIATKFELANILK